MTALPVDCLRRPIELSEEPETGPGQGLGLEPARDITRHEIATKGEEPRSKVRNAQEGA